MTAIPPKTYVFDLDGVIYRGSEPLPHARDTVCVLRDRGRRVYFLTNNSTRSRSDYCENLARMGIRTDESEVMTSAYATAHYLSQLNPSGCKAYVVGEQGLIDELESAGVTVLRDDDTDRPHYVIAGLDRGFAYAKLARAQREILGGAAFVATNRDPTYPIEDGGLLPGGGSIVSAIETASGTVPFVVGKPATYTVEFILQTAGCLPEESVMVGDRLDTDVLAGNRAGMRTVFVLTGVCSEDDVRVATSEMRPDRIIRDLSELVDEEWFL